MGITEISKRPLEHNHLSNLATRTCSVVEPLTEGNPHVRRLAGRVKDGVFVLNSVLNRSRKSGFAKILNFSDLFRDDGERGFVFQVKAWTCRRTQPQMREAALKLQDVLDFFGTAYNKGYKKQTAKLQRIFKKLDSPEYQQLIEMLGIVDWYTEWKQLAQDFNAKVEERDGSVASREDLPQLNEAFNALYDRVEDLLNYLRLMETLEPEQYAEPAKMVDVIVSEIMSDAQAALTRKENAKEQGENAAEQSVVESEAANEGSSEGV